MAHSYNYESKKKKKGTSYSSYSRLSRWYSYLMQCIAPIEIKDKLGKYVLVPCGRCHVCLDRRRNDWFLRMKQEIKCSIYPSYFVTLTYDDENLPYDSNGNPCVSKDDVQKFFKRLRKKTESKVRYYLGSEYGPKTFRPHYHFCLFSNDDDNITSKIINSWDKGFVTITLVNDARLMYVAKYINKKVVVPDNYVKCFSLMSKGLGTSYLEDEQTINYHKQSIDNMFLMCDGKKYPLPRYYKERIFSEDERKKYARKCQKLALQRLEDNVSAYNKSHPKGNYFRSEADKIRESVERFKKKLKNGKL